MLHVGALWIRVPVVVACIALLVTPVVTRAADPYVVEVILPVTGGYAFIGTSALATLKLIEDGTNATGGIAGRPLRFNVTDDQSNSAVSVQLMSSLIARHVPIVIGPSSTASCRAVAPLLNGETVAYCLSPAIYPAPGSSFFVTSFTTNALLADTFHYFRERGWTRVAAITATDASGQDADQQIAAALELPENKNVKLVAAEHFNPADVTVAAQMAHIKASKAQALIAWVNGAPEATLMRGATDSGLDIPFFTSPADATYVQMKQYAEFLPKDLYFAGVPELAADRVAGKDAQNAVSSFDAAFAAKGIKPGFLETTVWDPAVIVISALRKLGPTATAAQIRDYIAGLHDFYGVNGRYDFKNYAQRGLGRGQTIVTRWDATRGSFVGVSKPGGAPL